LKGVLLACIPSLGENTTAPSAAIQGSQNPNITARYVGATSYTAAGTCSSGLLLRFGVKTWQPLTHANYPAEIGVYLDTNRDGTMDYRVYTAELNGASAFAEDGRNATYVGPIGGTYTSKFYTEHGANSGVFVMSVCGEQIGLTSTDVGKIVDARFYTADNYITDDVISTISTSLTILKDRYVALDPTSGAVLDQIDLAANSTSSYTLADTGANGSTAQGLLLLNTSGGTTEALTLGINTSASPSPTCQVGRRRWRFRCDDDLWRYWWLRGFFRWYHHH
ncbi:MAG: hypothetical protein HGA65_10445, partial [Oscillochloris sp.]|nr:hypothetical protein [Oscillochloris sp.]